MTALLTRSQHRQSEVLERDLLAAVRAWAAQPAGPAVESIQQLFSTLAAVLVEAEAPTPKFAAELAESLDSLETWLDGAKDVEDVPYRSQPRGEFDAMTVGRVA
jgi:hypothetical protein